MFFNLQFASGLGRFFCFLFFGPLTARLFSTRKIHSSHWRTNLVGRSFLRSYNSPKFLTGTNASPDFRKGNFWEKKQIFGPSYSTNMDCFNVFFPNKHNVLLIYLSAYNLKILVFTCGLAEAKTHDNSKPCSWVIHVFPVIFQHPTHVTPLGLEGGEVVSFDTLSRPEKKRCGGFLLGVTLTETNI